MSDLILTADNSVTLSQAFEILGPISIDTTTIILAINPVTGEVGTVNMPTGGGVTLNQVKQLLIDLGLATTTT